MKIKSYFQHELTPVLTSLFTDMMRKPNIASLVQSLLGKDYQKVDQEEIIFTKYHVVDRGSLLRKSSGDQDLLFRRYLMTTADM